MLSLQVEDFFFPPNYVYTLTVTSEKSSLDLSSSVSSAIIEALVSTDTRTVPSTRVAEYGPLCFPFQMLENINYFVPINKLITHETELK